MITPLEIEINQDRVRGWPGKRYLGISITILLALITGGVPGYLFINSATINGGSFKIVTNPGPSQPFYLNKELARQISIKTFKKVFAVIQLNGDNVENCTLLDLNDYQKVGVYRSQFTYQSQFT